MNGTETQSPEFGAITAPETVRIERLLPGPIERVWAYLVEPEKRKLWFADGPMAHRVGGAVELIWRNSRLSKDDAPAPDGFGDEARGQGTVTTFDPPRRLGFTWAHHAKPETEALFELSPRGDQVMLVITHRRLTTNDLVLGVSAGWHAHLEVLRAKLEDHEPPKFWATFGRMREVYRRRYGF